MKTGKVFMTFGKSRIVDMILLLALPLAAAGCGSGRPETFSVTGTVIYQGKPLAGATVNFIPKNTHPASGLTDAQGRFTLLSFSPDDGAVIGEHVVCVAKYSLDSSKDPVQMMKAEQAHLLTPQKFASPVTSPLRVTVTKDGPNDFRLELKN
jgi:hypothetical protein